MKFPFFCNLLALCENGKSVARVQPPSEEHLAASGFSQRVNTNPKAANEIAERQLMDAKSQLSIEFRATVVVAATYCF